MDSYKKLIIELELNSSSWTLGSGRAVADFFLDSSSFLTTFSNARVDLRELARSVHEVISISTSPAEALKEVMRISEDHFDTPEFATRDPSDSIQNAFLTNVGFHVSRQIYESKKIGIVGFLSELASKKSLTRWSEMVDQSIATTMHDVEMETKAIIQKYSLNSIEISGDVTSAPAVQKRMLDALRKDLDTSCEKLGIDASGFGNSGKLAIVLASKQRMLKHGAAATISPVLHERGIFPDAKLTYWPDGSDGVTSIMHEYAHYVDFLLAKKAMGTVIDPKTTFFSHLSFAQQDALPGAKEAFRKIYSVLESGKSEANAASKAVKDLRGKLVMLVAGDEQMLAMSSEKLKELTCILNENDDFLFCSTSSIQNSARWSDAIYHSLVTIPSKEDLEAGGSGKSIIDRVASCLGVSVEDAATRYRAAIPQLEKEILRVAPYSNQMSRYVTNPGAMLEEAAKANYRDVSTEGGGYWTSPTEVFARIVGRFHNVFKQAHYQNTNPELAGTYSKSQLIIIEHGLNSLIKAAGIKQTEHGANLGLTREKEVQFAVDAIYSTGKRLNSVAGLPIRLAAEATSDLSERFGKLMGKSLPERPLGPKPR